MVTVTSLVLSDEEELTVNIALIVVELTTVTPLTVILRVLTFTLELAVKLVPISVTGVAAPRGPELGVTEVNVGADRLEIVNATDRKSVV